MRKVLKIAYFYPPIASVGVLRTLKFAKYLPRFGWKPVVLTARNPDPYAGGESDPDYVRDRLSEFKVYRSYSIPLGWILKVGKIGINYKWFFLLPDVFIGWLPFAFSLGKRIIAKEKIDVIYVSSPPVVGLVIGMLLKKVTKKPLVIDYRDLWTGNPFTSYPTRAHYRLEKAIEGEVLRNADAVITVSNSAREKLVESFPFLREADVHVITNGYDPDDFLNLEPHKYERFTILHTGTIYGPRASCLDMFLEALHRLLLYEEFSDFQIVLVGKSPPSVERKLTKSIQEWKLLPRVIRLGRRSHTETLQFALGADVLLLIPGSPSVVPAKIFEYLAAGRFIVNISEPRSEAAQIIDEAKAGITIEPNVSSLEDILRRILSLKQYEVDRNMGVLGKFSRVELAKKLALVLDQYGRIDLT